MKKLFLFLLLLPTLLFAQKSVPIKVRSAFDSTVLNPYKKAYYTIGQSPDSSYVTIKSIDGTQVDTIHFAGGTGVIGTPQSIYGQFSSNARQITTPPDSTIYLRYDSVAFSNGISLVGGDKIYVSSSGKYQINSILNPIQSARQTLGVSVNGINVKGTNQYQDNNNPYQASPTTLSYILNLNAGDYIQIAAYGSYLYSGNPIGIDSINSTVGGDWDFYIRNQSIVTSIYQIENGNSNIPILPRTILHLVDSATTGWSADTLNVINYTVPNDGVLHHYELKMFRASGTSNRYASYSVGPYGIPIYNSAPYYVYQTIQDLTYQYICSPGTPIKLIGPVGTSPDYRALITLIEIAQYPLPTY